ncbi:MAG: hypothetical protein NC930_07890 [Candidatus Omnitrophica bacterium]|nr:hypothetical protein [Candidatus Omnitrophota bacterium]
MIQWLVKDWGLKLISLILAIGLWYYAVGEEGIEVNRVIPLQIDIVSEKIGILKRSTDKVAVTLQAPRALLSDVTTKDVYAHHKIHGPTIKAGDYSFRLEPREIKLPTTQIRVLKIHPEIITVTLDELIVQKLEVKPSLVGEPTYGYRVIQDDLQLDPNAVLVQGPKEELEKLDGIKTEDIMLVGRVRSFRKAVRLKLPSNIKPLSESLVEVYIPIKEEFSERTFENIPIRILNTGKVEGKIEVDPLNISLILKGPKRRLEELVPESILAYVDLSSFSPGVYDVPVVLVLSKNFSLKDDSTIVVKVKIKQ